MGYIIGFIIGLFILKILKKCYNWFLKNKYKTINELIGRKQNKNDF